MACLAATIEVSDRCRRRAHALQINVHVFRHGPNRSAGTGSLHRLVRPDHVQISLSRRRKSTGPSLPSSRSLWAHSTRRQPYAAQILPRLTHQKSKVATASQSDKLGERSAHRFGRTVELSHAGPGTQANPRLHGKSETLPGVGCSDLVRQSKVHRLKNLRPGSPYAQRRPAMSLRWECNREPREIHEMQFPPRWSRTTKLSVVSVPQW